MLDILPQSKPQHMNASRRKPHFDRAKLQRPEVQQCIKRELAKIMTPPAYFEQTTRAHLVARAIRSVVEYAAPLEKKPQGQHWISDRSHKLVECRDYVFRQFRRTWHPKVP